MDVEVNFALIEQVETIISLVVTQRDGSKRNVRLNSNSSKETHVGEEGSKAKVKHYLEIDHRMNSGN